ncbi:TetR/AcrR family transcriptional regulator [Pseudonocardia sp. KRD291]|uniref:TetR/AcrR family transcriptional regulator n=1 Tax=Pseudonocardia sp. KRD291 TaxID=2792007 RepID=UPI001C4A0DF3|nr:TetR/AcrR family transcriptional regulator [Pseudonocardia sp. KRD291]MBW0102055.1 TetR/AcrR family transcriptional regulator [Pseudonocardia sp. KRD291]
MAASASRPRRDQLRNREALITAAKEVFAERGLEAPLDLIARRARLSNASLYRHFPRREDLVVGVLLQNLARAERALAEALARRDGWAGFVHYFSWLFTEQIDNPAYLGALRAVPAGHSVPVDRMRDKLFTELEELIARAKRHGGFRPDRWLEDVFLYLALNEHLAQGYSDPHSASQRFLELALSALRSDEAEQSVSGRSTTEEPDEVVALRRTLGHEIAGLPLADGARRRDSAAEPVDPCQGSGSDPEPG